MNSDDDSSTGSLLVSPTQNIETNSWSQQKSEETTASIIRNNFKNNGHDDNATAAPLHNNIHHDRSSMDVTFQEDDTAAEDDMATPLKERKFSYAAAMEQLDDSWLAPTPNKQHRRAGDLDDDGLDLTLEEEEEEEEVVGKCLQEQFVESPVKQEELSQEDSFEEMAASSSDESIITSPVNQEKTNAIPSPDYAALAPAPNNHSSPTATTTTAATTAELFMNQDDVPSPNNKGEAGADSDATSTIFRHPSLTIPTTTTTNNNPHQFTTSDMMGLQLGHPINESYDSVEQRKIQLEQSSKHCISSFLVDRDRVENDIVVKSDGVEELIDDSGGDDDDDGGCYESEVDTLTDHVHEEEDVAATNETELSIQEEEDDDESFNKSMLGALEKHSGEAELTLTQAADCTTDSDVFWKTIDTEEKHLDEAELTLTQAAERTTDSDVFWKTIEQTSAAKSEEDDLMDDCEEAGDGNGVLDEESDVAEEEDQNGCDRNEFVHEDQLVSPNLEALTAKNDVALTDNANAEYKDDEESENKNDTNEMESEYSTGPKTPAESVNKVVGDDAERNDNEVNRAASEYHLSSPSVSPVELNNSHDETSPVRESSDLVGGPILEKNEDIIEYRPELASSRVDSLAFSTSADTDDMLELSQHGSEDNGNTEKAIDSDTNLYQNHDSPTFADPKGSDNVEYSTSNQPSSEVEAGINLSFDSNSMSASLDVSLSNIDREALFASSFSQHLSPIRQNSSSPHDLSQRHDDDLKGDEISLPATVDTSVASGGSFPNDSKPLGLDNSSPDPVAGDRDDRVEVAGDSLEDSPATPKIDTAEVNKGSIFAVLSQVNTDASKKIRLSEEIAKNEDIPANQDEDFVADTSREGNGIEQDNDDAYEMEARQLPIETFADKQADIQNPNDYELDDRNKSLEDLSSYQQSFNSTSTAFLERLRGAAENRKREVTKARFSMERKEQILYEEKEVREVLPTLSEASEMAEEPIKRTTDTKQTVKTFNARPLPSHSTLAEPKVHRPKSTSTIGTKRKSSNALRPHTHDNKPSGNSAVSAKPPKRLLSGEAASNAKEMTRMRLLQEEEERIRRESVFRARPLPASTLPRGGILEQPSRTSHKNSKVARAGKENSAFKPSSSARAEERAAYNEEKKAREEARRQEQIRRRNALINETNAEIDNLKRFLR